MNLYGFIAEDVTGIEESEAEDSLRQEAKAKGTLHTERFGLTSARTSLVGLP